MAYDPKLKEEEIKNKVAVDVFGDYDCTRILGAVDFCVSPKTSGPQLLEPESLLWAEAKAGVRDDFAPLFAQLVLTLGKARTFDDHLPPPYLAAFDSSKIAFLPYHEVVDLFYLNDFNWKVAPSDETTREFGIILDRVRPLLDSHLFTFRFDEDAIELDTFVRKALCRSADGPSASLNVTRNNFVFVYQKWARDVKPSIAVNWDGAKKQGILDADFFLADLLSKDGATLVEKLYVVLRGNHYELDRKLDAAGFIDAKRAEFNDGQKAHQLFWNHYRRPPKKEYWHYIAERRDLLVPQDVRERKGSFFTPQIWVEKAQEAIAAVLGENWQDEYDVWDCAAGTGNLLAGLQNKYRIWASTLDQADVEVMKERIKNGANLLESHVFRFDFLNDSFNDLPDGLKAIVNDPERRKKLVVFINPPYAEAGDARQRTGTGKNKTDVAVGHAFYAKCVKRIGLAGRELFAQFLMRIHDEIPECSVGQFSTLKHLQGPNFKAFRQFFRCTLEKCFLVPASTFDNVNGEFPIGFFVWRINNAKVFASIEAEVFDDKANPLGKKTILSYDTESSINDWLIATRSRSSSLKLGFLSCRSHDVQHINDIYIKVDKSLVKSARGSWITETNLVESCVYYAVCHCTMADWLNNRDQFLWPADTWRTDYEFQLDCLVFTLFHGQNRISCKAGVNHWIPFPETEVEATDAYKSHFMVDFLKSILATKNTKDLCAPLCSLWLNNTSSLPKDDLFATDDANELSSHQQFSIFHSQFSIAASRVMDAGRVLWRYYHAQPTALPDASFYDIRAHFQGFKPNGHMNPDSSDAEYTRLIRDLREAMKALASKIAPKVREHGFLR
jgi:predicted RNA methylase